ncbi:MAG TPA: alanine--tRNA ligase [Candidatus Saccharimonadales bacterium]|nr:alanine--tRNA ligase [Candidatus Saccharimonadales bacterium]
MDSQTIRERFIKFFEEKGHHRMPSAPLVLMDDPSVLFTSAGMQPIVPYFLGKKQPPAKRLVTVQKCFRTTDLEVVGFDTYHNTFFEMLGNFGIGDYWKKEAIGWGWELLTTQFEIDPKTLVATIYFDDDEAFDIWTKELALLPPEKVFRLGNLAKGDDTNFWSPGPTGLCGPCSEVFVDRGPQPGTEPHDCNPGEDCGRYLEIWNFVFQQYDRKEDGTLAPLAKRNIDTGAGLERTSQVLQGVTDTFKTDLFQPLVKKIESLSGTSYGADPQKDVSIRVVAEHARAAAFLIADGIAPSNEGRGYVLRRLIRRAALHGRRLELKTGALTQVAGEVVKSMQKHYHELTSARERIAETIGAEEEKFERTLASGMEQLAAAIAVAKERGQLEIDGDTAFRLYDTFGFPMEMTRELVAAAGIGVDEAGFKKLLDAQRQRGRAGAKFSQDAMRFGQLYADLHEKHGLASTFTGYTELASDSTIRSLVIGGERVDEAREGQDVEIVLDRTPFYPEGGGQVGDRGDITTSEGRALVADTQTAAASVIVMSAKVVDGVLRAGAPARASVDTESRQHTMRNHTATHLLHATLRRMLGDDVHQAGSLVHAPNLRFDFTFGRALTPAELRRVEDEVNDAILANASVHAQSMSLHDALASGATHLFDEKYGDEVRVVEAGPTSRELCGGTHCHCTGDIGLFLITKEESIGAGVRRIEAVTGEGALREVHDTRDRVERAAGALKVPPARLPEAVAQMAESRERLEKQLASLQKSGVDQTAAGLVARAETLNGSKLLVLDVGDYEQQVLRGLADRVRDGLGSGVTVLGSTHAGRPGLAVAVSKDLVERVHAGNLVKELSSIIGGSGGGPANSATGGGKDAARLGDALEAGARAVRDKLGGRN